MGGGGGGTLPGPTAADGESGAAGDFAHPATTSAKASARPEETVKRVMNARIAGRNRFESLLEPLNRDHLRMKGKARASVREWRGRALKHEHGGMVEQPERQLRSIVVDRVAEERRVHLERSHEYESQAAAEQIAVVCFTTP